ncbi:MAG: hypothetical protein GX847_09470 [Clostridiales bacterium]|nr:hypothetical protein [Clostridiales bacterium]
MDIHFAQHTDIPDLIRLRLDFFDDDPVMKVTGDKRGQIAAQLKSYYTNHLNRDFFAALAEVDGMLAAV